MTVRYEISTIISEEIVETSSVLSELSRTTTAYHDAEPDRVEAARQEYVQALRKYKALQAPR